MMRNSFFTLVVVLALLSVSSGQRKGGRRKGDNGQQCSRDMKGARYGTDPIYNSDDDGCCEQGFHYRDSRCVGCHYGLHFTRCKHSCTLYCDPETLEPSVNCSGLSGGCEAGCECPPGLFETSEGDCVNMEYVCPEKSNGTSSLSSDCTDENSFFDECQSSCISTCRNFQEVDTDCAAVCVAGCRCVDGYVFDEYASLCVLPANCTVLPSLPQNALWACCEGDCLNPFPVKCDLCEFGPKCKRGFVRNISGDCVDYQECDSACDANEVYDTCSSDELTCLNYRSALTPLSGNGCQPGCQCRENYVRNHLDGTCVLPSDCPVNCMESYEVPGCSSCNRLCEDPASMVDCSSCSQFDVCVCDSGYARDGEGDCVQLADCPPQTSCDPSLNQVEACDSCIKTCDDPVECTLIPSDCSLACGCAEGYLLNERTGECVLPSECPICDDCVSSDNSHNYKKEACLPLLCFANKGVTYTVKFVGTWNDTSHPDFGFTFSHWSPLTGASHKPSYEIWENCFRNVTQGVRNVAERGSPSRIHQEYSLHSQDVLDTIENGSLIPGDGKISRNLDVNKNFHYITLLSMMGNTKDYMVGVDRLDMCTEDRDSWKSKVKVCLKLYSTGTQTELEDGCASHSRQFANCSFGYMELTLNPTHQQDASRCTGQYEEFSACGGYCQARCEHGGQKLYCPRVCISGCKCIDGYARDDREECILLSECDTKANARCEVSEWIDFAIAMYTVNPEVRQMKFVTQRPTGKYNPSTCPTNSLSDNSCENSTLCRQSIPRIEEGCAVWIDTCFVEFKCGTTSEFDDFITTIDDSITDVEDSRSNRPFFEPIRKHGDTAVNLESLNFLETDHCNKNGDKCQWTTPPSSN